MRKTLAFGVRFAFLLSLLIHLFFVTGVEAAVFLGKVLTPRPSPVLIFSPSSVILSDSAKDLRSEILPPYGVRMTSEPLPRVSARTVRPEQNFFEKSLTHFEDFQKYLDQRIQNFRSTLDQKTLLSQVSDLEKVPAAFQVNILPAYLERMRFKIAQIWAKEIESSATKSGILRAAYRVMPSGEIREIQVLEAEGGRAYERACLNAIRKADPLEPLPFHFTESTEDPYLTVTLTFYFRR